MNKQLINSIKPGHIYVLYFKNGKKIILKITHVNSRNGSVRGYDCFGMQMILCIHCIYGFGTLASFPRLCPKMEKNKGIQDVNVTHKSNKSYDESPLESERVIVPNPPLDIKGEKTEDVDLIQEQNNPLSSIEYSNNNNPQSNHNLPNNIKHESIIAKERNTLLSIKIISINGNSSIEKSGGSIAD
ncbi:hypothetical protein F7984_10530 [Pradoshia sp. D12]|uniref:hypothetical protein n=1 Tax=Bacillaceae TaxID=186817 RepID=UPI0011273EB3|nr:MULTISPECIES: hypothetical protein [Bacillaceae]QFK71633.1 hypothetical protein F7984_10530 [Pradoshia sp. D12]TPF73428.1 hypothetical protein FHY44_06925 [Bacillus sp. D12]